MTRSIRIDSDDNDQWPDWVYAASRHMVDEGALRFRLLVGPVLDALALAQPVDDVWEYRCLACVSDDASNAVSGPNAQRGHAPHHWQRRRVGGWEPVERGE